MTTTKTGATGPTATTESVRPMSHQDLQAAYQIHTLAQMLYGRMGMPPWIAPGPPMFLGDTPPAMPPTWTWTPQASMAPWVVPAAPWTTPAPWAW